MIIGEEQKLPTSREVISFRRHFYSLLCFRKISSALYFQTPYLLKIMMWASKQSPTISEYEIIVVPSGLCYTPSLHLMLTLLYV
jgi:hypothetical protein